MSFLNISLCSPGVRKGLKKLIELAPGSSIIRPSAAFIRDVVCLPQTRSFFSGTSRQEFQDLLIPVCITETLCDLVEKYFLSPLKYRKAVCGEITTDSFSSLSTTTLSFQVETSMVDAFSNSYGSTLWLLHRPRDSSNQPSIIDFKSSPSSLDNGTIFIFMKSLTSDPKKTPKSSSPPAWPSGNLVFPCVNAQMSLMQAKVYFVNKGNFVRDLFNRNVTESDVICDQREVGLTYVGRLTQFLKAMRMCSLPDLPTELSPTDDYNVCPLFDLIVKNQPFPPCGYIKDTSFLKKFRLMMDSPDPGVLIVDGAPGTGKTKLASHTIAMYIWLRKQIGKKVPRILVTAPSNAAADVIFLKLLAEVEEDPTVVVRRTGERSKFSQRVLSTVEKDESVFKLSILQEENGGTENPPSENFIKQQYLLRATIVVTTLGSSQSTDLASIRHSLDFDLLVVDECGQASCFEFLYPLYFPSISKLLLVGDPRQLGPVIKWVGFSNYQPNETSLFVNFYERLQREDELRIIVLRKQYRLRKSVAEFVSAIAYNDQQGVMEQAETGNWEKTLSLPEICVFSGDSWEEKKADCTFSHENHNEMVFGLKLLEASMKQAGFNFHTKQWSATATPLKYAIISLYQGQVSLFTRSIKQLGLQEFVRVSTVDQMQGSEVDVAIVSAVRGSTDESVSVGFADDLRRLTVALSRAACVYVLAKYSSFKSEIGWQKLYQLAARHQRVITNADSFETVESIFLLLQSFSANPISDDQ